MLLYFLRHASAGQHKIDPIKDEKRPLDDDGVEQCALVGRALVRLQVAPDVIVSSPLKRALQTASLVADELSFADKIIIDPALRPEATFSQFRDLLARHETRDAVMVVGHNPNLSEFLGRLVGGSSRAAIELKKGGIARVEVSHTRGVLNWYLTPKLLRALTASGNGAPQQAPGRKKK